MSAWPTPLRRAEAIQREKTTAPSGMSASTKLGHPAGPPPGELERRAGELERRAGATHNAAHMTASSARWIKLHGKDRGRMGAKHGAGLDPAAARAGTVPVYSHELDRLCLSSLGEGRGGT